MTDYEHNPDHDADWHYAEAERLLTLAKSRPEYNEREIAAAQVHATLALADYTDNVGLAIRHRGNQL